ncbi:hypothetical protein [Bifidobacterium oedipodis]|uniref:Uncharacterized protein n=1 Tax=Bifidobacterium oedipodis TaxID=2675322 RepID=A0A7Y0ERS0_9BIFI|nr:hypothetical protein [Bifidobacterium sp. DSM 109957]NMM94783.1 hypothetical protein [Bifidobacterium sp. DSM 109957]
MACFIVPTAEAVAVAVVRKLVVKKELESGKAKEVDGAIVAAEPGAILLSRKIMWLLNLLLGGAILLAVEHIWHGEVVPWPPFLTAMRSAADTRAMLFEMATTGVGMAVLVTAVWFVATLVADRLVARSVASVALND